MKWLSKKEVTDFNKLSVSDIQLDTNGDIHGKLIPSIEERLWRFVEFLDKKIDEELERDKNALINILNGREFHDMGE